MRYLGVRCERRDEQLLLLVGFEGAGGVWMPKWEEVRQLFETACLVECVNSRGRANGQLRGFGKIADSVRRLVEFTKAVTKAEEAVAYQQASGREE